MKQYLQEDELEGLQAHLAALRCFADEPGDLRPDHGRHRCEAQDGDSYRFRVTGSVLKFEGFLKVYEESKDNKDEEDDALKHKLPPLVEGQKLTLKGLSRNSTSRNRLRASTKRRW